MLNAERLRVRDALLAAGFQASGTSLELDGVVTDLHVEDAWVRLTTSPIKVNAAYSAPAPAAPVTLLPGDVPHTVRLTADLPRRWPAAHNATVLAPDFALADLRGGGQQGLTRTPDPTRWAHAVRAALQDLRDAAACATSDPLALASEESTIDTTDTTAAPAPDDAARAADEALADLVQRRGFRTTRRGTELRIDLEHAHVRRHLVIRREASGVRLVVELADTTRWSEAAHEAVSRLAHRLRPNLRLARLIDHRQAARRALLLEVHLGPLEVDSPWLDLAIRVLDDAVVQSAEAWSALADAAVAHAINDSPVFALLHPSRKGAQQ